MMILDEMDDYDVYDDVVMNLYDELYDDIYIYIIPRMNVLLFFTWQVGNNPMLGFFVVHLGEIQRPLRLQGRVPVRQQVRCSPRNDLGLQ